jgi:four helix bundle protein
MSQLKSFRDLKGYQKLKALHLEGHHESLLLPKFERYELGLQGRRSSNAAPALLAEGWGSRHTNLYIEAVHRALGEVRETPHPLDVAKDKKDLTEQGLSDLDARHDECGRRLEGLPPALSEWQETTRTGKLVREDHAPYGRQPFLPTRPGIFDLASAKDEEFPWNP